MSYTQIYMLLGFILLLTNAATGSFDASQHLDRFGYIPEAESSLASLGLRNESVLKPPLMNLKATGELDHATKKAMSMPRCGVQDNVAFINGSRSKRFAFMGSNWGSKSLTYRIAKYSEKLSKADVNSEIARACALWSEHTDLKFTQVCNGPADITISFFTGYHGDSDAFDGKDGFLAHATAPREGAYIHFDDAEDWTIDNKTGINLFQVATHEFGHALGLAHSNENSALMYKKYSHYIPNFHLHPDDVLGIQALYGKKTSNDSLCKDPKIDTIFTSADNQMYAFKGDKYYKLTVNTVEEGYPKPISEGWPGLPNNIDAAFTYSDGRTRFFKGDHYWIYNGRQFEASLPISSVYIEHPPDIFTALATRNSDIVYLFGREFMWIHYSKKSTDIKLLYNGLPCGLDAAFQHTNGHVYFFKGDKCYQLNEGTDSVKPVTHPFSPPSVNWLLSCNNNNARDSI